MSSLYEGLFFHRQYAEQYVGIITTRLEMLNKLYHRPLFTDAAATKNGKSTIPTTIPPATTSTPANANTSTPATTTTANPTATPAPLPPLQPSGPSMPRDNIRPPVLATQTYPLPPVVRSAVQPAERRVLVDGFRYQQQQLRTPNLGPIVEPIRAAWRRRFATGVGTSNIRVTAQTLYFMPTAVALHLLDRYHMFRFESALFSTCLFSIRLRSLPLAYPNSPLELSRRAACLFIPLLSPRIEMQHFMPIAYTYIRYICYYNNSFIA